jgi:fucose 4-O-acetylase-like acetyltransferase
LGYVAWLFYPRWPIFKVELEINITKATVIDECVALERLKLLQNFSLGGIAIVVIKKLLLYQGHLFRGVSLHLAIKQNKTILKMCFIAVKGSPVINMTCKISKFQFKRNNIGNKQIR